MHCRTSSLTISQYFLKKRTVKPSGPVAFVELRLANASKISSSVGMELRRSFSSSVMMGGNRFCILGSIEGLVEVKIFVKWAEKWSPISVLEDTQTPESSLRKLTAFDLLLIKVERWKYLVFKSLHVSHDSLDLDLHRDSSLIRRLSRSALRLISSSKEE
jgi:hypothetical protein